MTDRNNRATSLPFCIIYVLLIVSAATSAHQRLRIIELERVVRGLMHYLNVEVQK